MIGLEFHTFNILEKKQFTKSSLIQLEKFKLKIKSSKPILETRVLGSDLVNPGQTETLIIQIINETTIERKNIVLLAELSPEYKLVSSNEGCYYQLIGQDDLVNNAEPWPLLRWDIA